MDRNALACLLSLLGAACAADAPTTMVGPPAPGGTEKEDSGFVSDVGYELEAVLTSRVAREATGDFANLATDRGLQEDLIDNQIKFGKRAMMAAGYELNQLADEVDRVSVQVDGDVVTLTYEAIVDLVKNDEYARDVPALEDLATTEFEIPLPVDPINMMDRFGDACAGDTGEYSLREGNYYYYYDPAQEDCELETHAAALEIRRVFPRVTVYPEYDQLLHSLGDDTEGFTAALLPTRGDDDPKSTFDNIKAMLEDRLDLEGELAEDKTYVRYRFERNGATAIIDLYDPTENWFVETFRTALGRYDLVHYAGHSEYGTRDLLTDQDRFSDDYQIVMMWSCHSYAYYSRQIFRAKRTGQDPTGFAAADVVATAPTPFFTDEDDGIEKLLVGLVDGIAAVKRGEPESAPSWLDILAAMNRTSWDRPYGAAGVRTNRWQPAE